ncbi:PQQ-dependent sugar dehydrogenase [Streptomyces sp. NPDC001985]|uniref:PQQ-dependent sugar dehydrogenase n=1 Tax=Streptomyces sp. NPDC001985 TaxID=3154406 RepID=UPI00333137BF
MHRSTTTRTRLATTTAAVAAALLTALVPPAGATGTEPPATRGNPTGVTQISTGWTIPWGASWLPDRSAALVTERDSFKVLKVTPSGGKSSAGSVPHSQTTGGEGGLMGVAVDPNWASNRYVYFLHTSTDGNRVARMTYNGSTLSGYTALVSGIKKAKYHNGGALAFGPDGYLYAATGDAQTTSLAQDRNSLNGKILRITRDGAAAPGNPFNSRVFSLGHRNPQGLAFDSRGRLWSAELGQSTADELNLIKSGHNYGWPACEGSCGTAGMTNPKKTWGVAEASPSGIAIVDNAVYMASLRGKRLWEIPISPDNENTGTAKAYYAGTYGRLRGVTKVPGANQLWLSTTNTDGNGGEAAGADRILRVTIG